MPRSPPHALSSNHRPGRCRQGKVAPPDYRDYLADLIEERYGSRYRFCKEGGVDPGHLSRVFASRSELSVQNLQRILEALPRRAGDPTGGGSRRASEPGAGRPGAGGRCGLVARCPRQLLLGKPLLTRIGLLGSPPEDQ